MTTASLTLTGSIAALTAALQAFEAAQTADHITFVTAPQDYTGGNSLPATPTASTDTGAGIPAPMPPLSDPSGVASTPTVPSLSMLPVSTDSDDEDEDGEASDGTGVDAEGLPWDERIHSSSKKKTAKGLWAARKGGPKGDALAAIKDELRGVTQVPLPVPMPVIEQPALVAAPSMPVAPMPVPPVPIEPVAAPVPMPTPIAVEQVVPVAPVPMPAPAPVEQPAAPAAPAEQWDFAKLMAQIGPKMGTVITPDYLAQVCATYGIGAITDTATKPELIAQLVAQFQADGRW